MNVLEINDAGLLLSDGERVLMESPGFAALDGRQMLVGQAAFARSRLDPRRSHNRFWYQLEATLPPGFGSARSHADLAFAQLQSLAPHAGIAPLMLAVPGTFTHDQLGLLLGLVEASGLKAQGMVDTAVAAASTVETEARCLHLDVELHRFVLTVIEGGELARARVEEISKPGLTAVWDALARVAAQAFVQQTRFDPLHTAATEQVLFDALPGWLDVLAQAPGAVLQLAAGTRTHRANVAREDLVQRLAERYGAIADAVDAAARPRPATLLLSARAAAVPGLREHLEYATGLAAACLGRFAPAQGSLAHVQRIVVPGAGLAYITRLPGRVRSAGADDADEAPTHVLSGDRAHPLPRHDTDPALPLARLGTDAPGVLRRLDGRLWLDGSSAAGGAGSPDFQLNGRPVKLPARLALGDRIECGGLVLRLIAVSA